MWKERGVTSLEELEKQIDSGALKTLKGMGDKKIATIKKGISDYKSKVATGGEIARRTGGKEP